MKIYQFTHAFETQSGVNQLIGFTHLAVSGLCSCRLVRHNTFGAHSPFTIGEKVASLALKLFIVCPVVILCSLADLIIFPIFAFVGTIATPSNSNQSCCKRMIKNIFYVLAALIARIVMPILMLGISLSGRSPAMISKDILNKLRDDAIYHHDGHLLQQCFQNGAGLPPLRFIGANNHGNGHPQAAAPPEIIRIVANNINDPNEVTAYSRGGYDFSIDGFHNFPLHSPWLVDSAAKNSIPMIDALVERNVDLNLVYEPFEEGAEEKDPGRWHYRSDKLTLTRLRDSVLTGIIKKRPTIDTFKHILKIEGIDLNQQGKGYSTPLAVAVMHGAFDFAEALIAAGADFYETDFDELERFLNAFNRAEGQVNYPGQARKYLKSLMRQILPEHKSCTDNIFFKALLSYQAHNDLMSLLFMKPNGQIMMVLNTFKGNLVGAKSKLLEAAKIKVDERCAALNETEFFVKDIASIIAAY